MSELKPGRRAILGYVIDESIQVGDLCWQGPLTLVRGQGTGALFTSADRDVHVIPDVPNLAAVARVLAAHPGIGEALARCAEYHQTIDLLDQKLDDDTVEAGEQMARWLEDYGNARDALTTEDTALIRALAAAMNGGTE